MHEAREGGGKGSRHATVSLSTVTEFSFSVSVNKTKRQITNAKSLSMEYSKIHIFLFHTTTYCHFSCRLFLFYRSEWGREVESHTERTPQGGKEKCKK